MIIIYIDIILLTVLVLTGHGCFGKYLHQIARREETPDCHECDAVADTAYHMDEKALRRFLLLLILFTCGYSVYRVHRLQQSGQVAILLKPTKVLFSHKKEGEAAEQLRTVVAYQNPFTGDYCVHKSREPQGYMNSMEPDSPDSGVSDEYEPLNLVPQPSKDTQGLPIHDIGQYREPLKSPMTPVYDNSVNKMWKWDYTEYQI